MHRPFARVVALTILSVFFIVPAFAAEWADYATISNTMAVNSGRVCIGDASTNDIGCPTYAPTVSSGGLLTATTMSTGGLTVSGAVSASSVSGTFLYGNQASFTALTVGGQSIGSMSGDRITSGTASAIANNAALGGYVSLTTGNTTWGYLGSSATYLPKIGSVNISASSAIQVGSNAITCGTGISGTMRYSATSSTMEYCNGSAWVSMGPSATTVPAFYVHKNGTNQTGIASNAFTLLTWSTETLDTNNNFASNVFTPTVAGTYLLTAQVYCSDSTRYCGVSIFKNNTGVNAMFDEADADGSSNVTAIVTANGTTDYFDARVYMTGSTVLGNAAYTNFSGVLISMAGGGSGGSATPAGNNTELQFNNSGSLGASSNLAWDNSARNLQVSGSLQIDGTGSETCSSAADYGKQRRNPTSGRMQVCLFR